ncbi:MAG: hypothetical protein MUF21_10880 [Gemmatimonadaceae bacterium]|jgi:hypothetical protein|nr:hypothetical protein [Gemmatimonadaceae bacterium]
MRKLQAFAALGVAAGAALFFIVLFVGIMTPVTPSTAGLDRGSSDVSRISVGIIMLAIISVALAFFRQLWRGARAGR